jgi:hypothetical protein
MGPHVLNMQQYYNNACKNYYIDLRKRIIIYFYRHVMTKLGGNIHIAWNIRIETGGMALDV